jgi:hypothetical protein
MEISGEFCSCRGFRPPDLRHQTAFRDDIASRELALQHHRDLVGAVLGDQRQRLLEALGGDLRLHLPIADIGAAAPP